MIKLAVLLPTYNAASYIRDSIDSILNQTFEDFHLFIYDDCSTDDTENIVSAYNDKRIFYRKNQRNLGIAKTLNKGFDDLLHNYQYIARMDADDWSYPERFESQLKMFEQDADLIMCGTQGYWLTDFEKNFPSFIWEYPVNYNTLKINLLFSGSFGHSSVIFNSNFLIQNNIRYNTAFKTCEDWELWTRIMEIGKAVNSPDFLMKYRMLPLSSHRNPENRAIHLKERSSIIARQWSNFGHFVDINDLFCFYYNRKTLKTSEFKRILKLFISLFNEVHTSELFKLNKKDQVYFRYRFARNILRYWKYSGISRFSFKIWWLIISKVKFMNKFRLIRSIIR